MWCVCKSDGLPRPLVALIYTTTLLSITTTTSFSFLFFFFYCSGAHRALHSFPPRRPSALASGGLAMHNNLDPARHRLIGLGIYRALPRGGWKLHSIRSGNLPVTQRLTGYERLEIQRFQLILVTNVLFPAVVVRDYKTNYVDDRIAHPQPIWDVFTYGNKPGSPVTVTQRKTDPPIPVPVREQP